MSELFLNLLDMSLAATWLIAAVILVRLLLKKAPRWITCLLWVLVAVRLVCPFSLESKLSLVPETDPVLPSIAEAYVPDTPIQVPAVSPEQTRPADTVQNSAIIVETPTVETVNYLEVAALIWLVGMATLLLYALISYLRLRRRVAASILMQESIRLCDGIDSPFILGLFRPRIYLPSTILQEDMAYVLAHERAHLARHDHWWKPLGFVLLAVYWFNPLVWVAYVLLCRDIELACDEKVIREMGDGEKKAYSEALLSCSVPRRMIAACPLAFGEVGVKSRIKSVLNYKKPAFWIIVVALVACVVLAVCFLTDPIKPTVHDVSDQNGYGISVINRIVTMTIKVPTDVLGDDAYSNEGHVYEPGEVVVYQNDTTTVYLEHVRYLEQYGEDNLFFDFRFDYKILDGGMVRTLFEPNIQDGKTVSSSIGGGVIDGMAWDSITHYPDSARLYGINQGVEVSIAIKTDVVREAQNYIAFDLTGLTDIYYEKGSANHEDDILIFTAEEEYRRYIQEKYDVYAAAEHNNVDPEELTDAIIEGLRNGFFSPFVELEVIEQAVASVTKNDSLSGMTVVLDETETRKEDEIANVELAKAIAAQFGNVSSEYTAYYNGAIEDAIGSYDYIQVRKQLDLSYGDKVPTYFLSPDRNTLVAVKQDKEGTNYSWTFTKNATGEWVVNDFQTKPSDHSVSTVGGADKPENIAVTPEDTSIGDAMKAAVEKLIDGKLPVTIGKLDPEGRIHPVIGHLNAWDCANAAGYGRGILSHTYQEVDALETSEALITLEFAVDGTEWGIIFYDGTDSVSVFKEGTEYLLQAIPDYEDIFLSPLGTLMRRWYDEAEYLFQCERVEVIPNTGQSYLEAAQEFCEAYEGVHLSVSSGSHYRYNEIFCRVEAAESATELFREKGEIGDNTYAFFAYTAFLPESERARNQSIAGNTALYAGNEPNVPEGALEYMRCGYITLKDDGWHGIIVGSGF